MLRPKAVVLLVVLSGCGRMEEVTMAIGLSPPDPLAAAERGKVSLTVTFGDSFNSWAGRTIRLQTTSPADVNVEPSEIEIKLDGQGKGEATVAVTPDKLAKPGARTVRFTAVGSAFATTSVDMELVVK